MRRLVDHLLLRLACIVIIADADVDVDVGEIRRKRVAVYDERAGSQLRGKARDESVIFIHQGGPPGNQAAAIAEPFVEDALAGGIQSFRQLQPYRSGHGWEGSSR